MRESDDRSRNRVVIVSLVLLAVTLITLDLRNVAVVEDFKSSIADGGNSTDSFFSRLTSPVRNMWHGVREYDDLKQENAELKAEVEALKGSARSEQIVAEQLSELAELQQLAAGLHYKTTTARRTYGTGSNWATDSFYIDKGRSSGLKVGNPVVIGAPEAPADVVDYPVQLIGVIGTVQENKSVVRLISDPRMRFSVKLIQSGVSAVGRGQGSDGSTIRPWLIETGVDKDVQVPNGDIVVTSGIELSAFPTGLPVGQVVSSDILEAENRQKLDVRPWVDFNSVDFVKILDWTPEALDDGVAPETTTTAPPTTQADDGLMDPGES